MKIETIFTISSDEMVLDVEGWSKKLEIVPLQCCRLGEKIPIKKSRSISRSSYWTTGIKKTEDVSMDAQLSKVLDSIHPKRELIGDLIVTHNLECGIASFLWVDVDEYCDPIETLDIHISTKNIKRLGDINADFSVCIY